jgi:hypothetical protein
MMSVSAQKLRLVNVPFIEFSFVVLGFRQAWAGMIALNSSAAE